MHLMSFIFILILIFIIMHDINYFMNNCLIYDNMIDIIVIVLMWLRGGVGIGVVKIIGVFIKYYF